MSYRLTSKETLSEGIQRMTHEQMNQALRQLYHPEENWEEAVHDARKCFKKIRAVLRLVRDDISKHDYTRENVCFRDAGRQLAEVRDSGVRIETLDELTRHFANQLAENAFTAIRLQFIQLYQNAKQRIRGEESMLEDATAAIQEAKTRVRAWGGVPDDFSAVSGGLKRVYKRGRKALHKAYVEPTAENFHEWRKRVKYLWYQVRILRPLWPNILKPLACELHKLANYLGDDHDLAELRRVMIAEHVGETGQEREALFGLIEQRQQELRTAARPLGERLYVEKPSDFTDRFAGYWKIWRR